MMTPHLEKCLSSRKDGWGMFATCVACARLIQWLNFIIERADTTSVSGGNCWSHRAQSPCLFLSIRVSIGILDLNFHIVTLKSERVVINSTMTFEKMKDLLLDCIAKSEAYPVPTHQTERNKTYSFGIHPGCTWILLPLPITRVPFLEMKLTYN